ncbi:MAG: DUF4097 domain-containing protein [Actinomycetes bacterium]|jgi:DUF4097 and DUF4098 domain-containing protein YvlB|nr:DUF4097 domain-containing protein [Actinomycetes bacterium]
MTMQPVFKTLWLIIAALVIVGAGLGALGFALGVREFVITGTGLHFLDEMGGTPAISEETSAAAFSKVRCDLGSPDVRFVTAADGTYGYRIENSLKSEVTAAVQGDTLVITENSKFHFTGFNFLSTTAYCRVTITVPANVTLDSVDVNLASGNLKTGSLDCDRMTVSAHSGDIDLTGLTAGTLSVELTSGNLKLTDTRADNLDIDLTSGDVTGNDVTYGKLDVDSTSGNVELSGDVRDAITLDLTSGDVQLNLTRPRSYYSKQIDTISGDVTFDGDSLSDGSYDTDATGSIRVSTTSGNVDIRFGTAATVN